MDRRIATLAERQHGVFSRAQARQLGVADAWVDRRAATGALVRTGRGVYRVRGAPMTRPAAVMSAVLAAGPGACASHTTAAQLWALDGIDGAPLEISVLDRRDLEIPGAVLHRPRTLTERDRAAVGAIPVTSPRRTLLDLAARVDAATLEIALDTALRLGLVRITPFARWLASLHPNGRRGYRTLRRLADERAGEPPSESPLETRLYRLLVSASLPAPARQHEIALGGGGVARVDFAYAAQRLAIEVDGWAHHAGRRRWEADRARDNALADLGWTVLRFTSSDVTRRGAAAVGLVRRRLGPRLG